MKIRNLYRDGLDEATFRQAQIAENWAVMQIITEEDLQQINGGIILTGSQAESKMGILLFRLLNCGAEFARAWSAEPDDLFLLSHLAGDRVGTYVFVEAQDVLMKYGTNIFTEV
jgi:bacteriocin-like protein